MKVFLINGAPTAGKTTFERLVRKNSEQNCYLLSTIDYIKEVAYTLGWNGEKTDKDRKFLSNLKDLLTEWNNSPKNRIMLQVMDVTLRDPNAIIFIDCREPDEIEDWCLRLNAQSVIVRNTKAENKGASNHADAEVLNYDYDIIIDNNGTLDDLEESALTFLENFVKENPVE